MNRRVIQTQHREPVERDLVHEVGERGVQRLERAVVIEVLGVDVRDDADRRRELEERAVALVGLGDEEVTLAEPRVRTERVDLAADHHRRVETGMAEHGGDEGRRRRLAVRARDEHAVLHAHQLGEHLGARNDRDVPGRCGDELGVVGTHRRRIDHDIHVADVRRGVSDSYVDTEGRQPVRHLRSLRVGSADLEAKVGQQLRDSAHTNAAHADEVQPVGLAEHVHAADPPSVQT